MSACLPEEMNCLLLPDDLSKVAKLTTPIRYKYFVVSEDLQECAITQQQQMSSTTADDAYFSALDSLRKWQRCYGSFAFPCVLVESLCKAKLDDVAVKVFGFSIPRQKAVFRGTDQAAVAVDVRVLNGLVTCKEYIDVLNHLSVVFASTWKSLGRSLDIPNERLDHYQRELYCNSYTIRDIVHEMVREWYRRYGVHCTLAALLDKCGQFLPSCRNELVSRIPRDVPGFTPPEPLVLAEEVLEGTACSLAFEKVSSTANQTENWRGLARRLGVYNTRVSTR